MLDDTLTPWPRLRSMYKYRVGLSPDSVFFKTLTQHDVSYFWNCLAYECASYLNYISYVFILLELNSDKSICGLLLVKFKLLCIPQISDMFYYFFNNVWILELKFNRRPMVFCFGHVWLQCII